jgi:hypothetical protein
MSRARNAIRLGLAAAAALPVPGAAQGTATAPLVLRLAGSTRALGAGNAFTAGNGAEVLFYNPSRIVEERGTALSYQRFAPAASSGTLVTAGALGKVAVAAGWQYLEYEGTTAQLATPGTLTTPAPLAASSLAATVGGALSWKGVSWGAALKFAEERRPASREGRLLLDAGASRAVGGIMLGIAVQNVGSDLVLDGQPAPLPTRVSVGAYLPPSRIGTYFDLAATAGVSRERGGTLVPGGGVEVTFEPVGGWRFAGRVGARRVDGGRPAESPFTLGASFSLDRFSLDYAYVPYRMPDATALALYTRLPGGAAHRIGIRIQ